MDNDETLQQQECKRLLIREVEKRMKKIFSVALQTIELGGYAQNKNYKSVRSTILRNGNDKIREVIALISNQFVISPKKHTIRFIQPGVEIKGEILDKGECDMGEYYIVKGED